MTTASDQALIDRFLDALWLEKGLSDNTLKAYRSDLEKFGDWAQRHANPIIAIRREDVLRYLSHRMGKGLKARPTARCLSCLPGVHPRQAGADRAELRGQQQAMAPTW